MLETFGDQINILSDPYWQPNEKVNVLDPTLHAVFDFEYFWSKKATDLQTFISCAPTPVSIKLKDIYVPWII